MSGCIGSDKTLAKSNILVIDRNINNRSVLFMKITEKNYDEVKADMKRFLLAEIERYSQEAGGKHRLSVKLGKSYTYAEMILKRDAFSALERLWKEILAEKENSA